MRELKFRAWDKSVEHLYEVQTLIDGGDAIGRYVLNGEMNYIHLCADEIIVEQYTGLKDRNGKEIYEGDIVGSDDGSRYLTGVVAWNEDYAKYEVIYNQLTGNSFEFEGDDGYPVANLCEVIGNIHENEELLEEEE